MSSNNTTTGDPNNLPPMIDAIRIRPLVSSSAESRDGGRGSDADADDATVIMSTPPFLLGRKNLCLAWWRACPRRCQAWLSPPTRRRRRPCVQHCRPVLRVAASLSRTVVRIDDDGRVRIVQRDDADSPQDAPRRTPSVRWTGRLRPDGPDGGGTLWIGPSTTTRSSSSSHFDVDDDENAWMRFSIVAVSDAGRSSHGDSMTAKRQRRKRIWLESSSSSCPSSNCQAEHDNGKEEEENDQSPNITLHETSVPRRQPIVKAAAAGRSDRLLPGSSDDTSSPPRRLLSSDRKKREHDDWTVSSQLPPPTLRRAGHRPVIASDDDERDIVLSCQVVRRDHHSAACDDDTVLPPRKVTPDEKRRRQQRQRQQLLLLEQQQRQQQHGRPQEHSSRPLTQTATTGRRRRAEDDAGGNVAAAAATSPSSSPMLHLPPPPSFTCSAAVSEIMQSWRDPSPPPMPQRRRRERRCRDLTRGDWRDLHGIAPVGSTLHATCDLVLSVNRHPRSRPHHPPPLWLPGLLAPDAVVIWERDADVPTLDLRSTTR